MLPLVLTRERTLLQQPNQLLIAESNHLLSIIYVVMSSFFNMMIDLFNTQKYLELYLINSVEDLGSKSLQNWKAI